VFALPRGFPWILEILLWLFAPKLLDLKSITVDPASANPFGLASLLFWGWKLSS
jgi:hypothetical protein